jgi:hypothetical protein
MQLQIQINPPKLRIAQNFFSYRVIEIWNNLSTKVGNANLDDLITQKCLQIILIDYQLKALS